MPDPLVHNIFHSKVLSKLTNCSPSWRGFSNASDIERLDAFIRRAKKFNLCSVDIPRIDVIFNKADDNFFNAVTSDNYHVLRSLLPPKVTHSYALRTRAHPFTLPRKLSGLAECNFLSRMLYKQCY